MPLERVVQELRNELARFEHAASQQKDSLNEIIRSLRADLYSQERNSSASVDSAIRAPLTGFLLSTSIDRKLANLEKSVQELRNQFTTFQCASNKEKDSLNETINSLRAEHQRSSTSIATLTHASLTSKSVRQQNRTSRTNQPGTPWTRAEASV